MINVLQVLPTISDGDGVSQDVIEINSILRASGYNSQIYAGNILNSRLKGNIFSFERIPKTFKEDIIIYHLSIGSSIAEQLISMEGKIVICYHNITPSHWFSEYDKIMAAQCEMGRRDMQIFTKRAVWCLADSEFNAKELREAGYKCPINVLPIIINFNKFERVQIRRNLESGKGNKILFTGRIVPNKKIENIIQVFSIFQKHYDSKAELYLVGNYKDDSQYYYKLLKYIDALKVKNIKFYGHVSNAQLNMVYSQADLYLSLSEHEGFCIPLLEAMYFHIPVVAFDSGAVSETMQKTGVLLDTKEPMIIAGIINKILHNSHLRKSIVDEQLVRLEQFEKINKKEILLHAIERVAEG